MPTDGADPVHSHPQRKVRQPWIQFRQPPIPQFSQLPDEVRGRVWKRCNRRTFKHWQIWVGSFVYILLATPLLWLLTIRIRVNSDLAMVLAMGFVLGLFLLPAMLKGPFLTRHLREEIGGLCLDCGYDLRATTERCPECGSPVPSVKQSRSGHTPSRTH